MKNNAAANRRLQRWPLPSRHTTAGCVLLLALVPWMLSCAGSKPQPVSKGPTAIPKPPLATGAATDSTRSGATEPWRGESELPLPEEQVEAGVPLGVLAPFSGPYAAYGKSYLDGAQLALQAARLQGIVRLVPADSEGDAIVALYAVRRLIEEENVVGILGGILSLPTLVAGVEANAHGVPMLSNVASEDGIRRIGPFVFHQVPARSTEARAAADLATFDLRSFRAAILSPEQGEGRDLASAFSEQFVALGGQVVASENYGDGTTDFNRMVRRIRNSDPDLLYLPMPVEDALLLAPALGFQGIDVAIMGTTHWQSDRLLRMTGLDMEGALVPAGLPQDDTAVLDDFERLYLQRFGSETNRFAAAGFIAARHMLAALAEETQVDRSMLQQRLAMQFGGGFENNAPMPFLLVREGALVAYPLQ